IPYRIAYRIAYRSFAWLRPFPKSCFEIPYTCRVSLLIEQHWGAAKRSFGWATQHRTKAGQAKPCHCELRRGLARAKRLPGAPKASALASPVSPPPKDRLMPVGMDAPTAGEGPEGMTPGSRWHPQYPRADSGDSLDSLF